MASKSSLLEPKKQRKDAVTGLPSLQRGLTKSINQGDGEPRAECSESVENGMFGSKTTYLPAMNSSINVNLPDLQFGIFNRMQILLRVISADA